MNPVPPFEAPGPLQLKISSQRTACTVSDTAGPTGSHLWKKTVSEVINRSPCSNSNVVAISEPAVVVVKCQARSSSVGQLLQVSASKYGWPSFSLAQHVWHCMYKSQSDYCGASSVSSHRASSIYIAAERFGHSCGPESTKCLCLNVIGPAYLRNLAHSSLKRLCY